MSSSGDEPVEVLEKKRTCSHPDKDLIVNDGLDDDRYRPLSSHRISPPIRFSHTIHFFMYPSCERHSFIRTAESALKSFLAGGVGGACVVLVGHPLDLVKVRMQTAGAGGSKNVFGMLSQTFAKEGIRGIYRGASAPLASISFIFAVCFCKFNFACLLACYLLCRFCSTSTNIEPLLISSCTTKN